MMRVPENELLAADFVYVRLQNVFVHLPTKEIYTAEEIDRIFPPVPVLTDEVDEGSLPS
jgi:hypothetical protein